MHDELTEFLAQFVTRHKLALFDSIIESRTRHLTVVLEDLHQPRNISACLRSCDCFGIQDVHVIEGENRFRVNADISLGAGQWLTIHRYRRAIGHAGLNSHPAGRDSCRAGSAEGSPSPTRTCFQRLRTAGYRIVALSPRLPRAAHAARAGGPLVDDYDVRQKSALVFGTELDGLSSDAREEADEFLSIPMVGFTESLNISVAVAICLHAAVSRLHRSQTDWRLSRAERRDVRAAWIRAAVGEKAAALEREFRKRRAAGRAG